MPGNVQAVDVPTDEGVLPYVVELDGTGRLISVPRDHSDVVRPEVCSGDAVLARDCVAPGAQTRRLPLRFGVGDRVACLAEASGGSVRWVAGCVNELWWDGDCDDARLAIPYLIRCDDGHELLCHRDAHELLRDLELQPESDAALAGSKRFAKRRVEESGAWEEVDHQTRRVRQCAPPREQPPAAQEGAAAAAVSERDPALLACGVCEACE